MWVSKKKKEGVRVIEKKVIAHTKIVGLVKNEIIRISGRSKFPHKQ